MNQDEAEENYARELAISQGGEVAGAANTPLSLEVRKSGLDEAQVAAHLLSGLNGTRDKPGYEHREYLKLAMVCLGYNPNRQESKEKPNKGADALAGAVAAALDASRKAREQSTKIGKASGGEELLG